MDEVPVATMTINGVAVGNAASHEIEMATISDFCHTSDEEESDGVLGLGTTRIEIVVTAEDSATTQTYTIDVHRNFENTS